MRKSTWFLTLWAGAVILLGAILTSYHQPFQTPDQRVLNLAENSVPGEWRVLHVLSGTCACSQRVMRHLLARRKFMEISEQILVIDGPGANFPESEQLFGQLTHSGFALTHKTAEAIPSGLGVRGVPLLVVAAPDGRAVYMGGYGAASDQDEEILRQVRAGGEPAALPILGCALSAHLRRQSDPFGLKYRGE